MNYARYRTFTVSLALVACVPLLLEGCGFIFSHGPPDGHEQMQYFSCTEGDAGPILDIVWGGLNVLGAMSAASSPDSYQNSGQIVAVGLTWGVVSGFSAATGFTKSKQCRAAKAELAKRQSQGGATPKLADSLPNAPRTVDSFVQAVIVLPKADTLTTGAEVQLVATAYASSGTVVPDQIFVWSSSNDAIASVSNTGLVTAHAAGAVVIAANHNNYVGTASIVVKSDH